MKSYKDKKLLLSLLALGLFAGMTGRFFETLPFRSPGSAINAASPLLATSETSTTPQATVPPTITLGFVGDIMLSRGIGETVEKKLGGDYSKLFANAEFLKTPDIMLGNLEGPVSNVGKDKHNKYSFRMDPKTVAVMKEAGIDVVSFANNHVGDWGRAAFEDTLVRLHEGGIASCGAGMTKAEAEEPAIFSKDGYTVGYICFSDVGPNDLAATETTSGILLASDPEFDAIVKSAATKVNSLIVSFHAGVEYEVKHDSRQEKIFKQAADNGAVLVVGAHPHVAEDIGTYKGVPLLYSLGNFIFDQKFSKDTNSGLFVTATMNGKKITDVVPHTVLFGKNFVPALAEAK